MFGRNQQRVLGGIRMPTPLAQKLTPGLPKPFTSCNPLPAPELPHMLHPDLAGFAVYAKRH